MTSGDFTTKKLIVFSLFIYIPFLMFGQRTPIGENLDESEFSRGLKSMALIYADKKPVKLLFSEVDRLTTYSHIKSNKDQYIISQDELTRLKNEKPAFFKQDLIVKQKKMTVALEKIEIFAPDFHVVTGDGEKIYPDFNQSLFYRGIIMGNDSSWVTCIISDTKIHYLIASEAGNYEIHSLQDGEISGYYSQVNSSDDYIHNCASMDGPKFFRKKESRGTRTGNCLEVYLECDNFTHIQLGNNLTTTTNWVNAIFFNVATIYALHRVPMVLRQVKVWTTTDPYTSINDLGTLRNQFVATLQNTYNGRVAQLLSLRDLGGGIANGIGGFCNSYPAYPGPQCVSTGLSSDNFAFPNYAYNTYLVAHEFGHVLGLRHTNACVWGTNLVQVDDCGNAYAVNNTQTPEGISCFNPSSPILPAGGGTIMSTCNQLPGSGINLSQGFGTIVGKVVFDNYIFAGCSTGSACNDKAPPNDLCTDAINLTVNNSCINYTFTNVNATFTSGIPAFSCGNAGMTIRDVWFKVVIPSSGSVTLQTSQPSGGLDDVVIEVYSGICSGTLTTIGCDDNSGPGNHALLSVTGRLPGETIYIRLVDHQSDQSGTFNICAFDSSVPCHPDFAALVAFYNGTGGPAWINKSGWQNGAGGTDCNVCSWYGITCNELGRVSTINLTANNVTASGFPPSFTNLTYLSSLRLYNNNLSGILPSIFTSFSFLHTLDLGGNDYTGSITPNLGNISTLKNLYLDGNLLTGSLPVSLTNIDLSLLYVNNNNLSGCIPTAYSKLCGKAYNFTGNPNLANGITFDDFCSTGNGSDQDGDTYCRGGLDCDDNNSNIFPGASETCNQKDDNCNGLIDDSATPITNTWIAGSGNWNNPVNWSLGSIPANCQNVMISGPPNITITVPDDFTASARSLQVSAQISLVIATSGELNINFGLNLINSGVLINNGNLTISNILDHSLFGISNNGTLINQASGRIVIQNSGLRSISNNVNGLLTNNGVLTIDRNAFNQPSTGIYNAGNITNNLNIFIRNIIGNDVVILPGATFVNQANGILSIE